MVCREMHLDPFLAERAFWDVHYAGAVHYDVDGWHAGPGKDLSSGSADGLLDREIEFESTVVHVWELCLECIDTLLDFGWVAACDDEMGRGLGGL